GRATRRLVADAPHQGAAGPAQLVQPRPVRGRDVRSETLPPMAAITEPARTELPLAPPCASSGAGIDYELFLDCVHCGLCTSACPTYVELGNEADSPRGRIYLMRAVTDGRLDLNPDVRHHLDLCLNCRACESACPSGVQYGKLIEPFRIHMAKTERQA